MVRRAVAGAGALHAWLHAEVERLLAHAPRAVAPDALRWAAARRAVAAMARARLRHAGVGAADGELFAAVPRGASPAQRNALAALGEAPAPPAALAAAVTFAQLGAAYPRLLAASQQKRGGTFFTPDALAAPTAARALAPLATGSGVGAPRVCDPAAGAGSFLLAALRTLVRQCALAPRTIVAQCLSGLDLDATAANLAAWSLHEACGDDAPPIAAIERNVRHGDGLLDEPAGGANGFDAVLGNPPWETLQLARGEAVDSGDDADTADAAGADAEYRRALRRRFAHQGRGKLYTYRLFVERAVHLLRRGGRLGMVVPASLYFDRDAAPLRELLLAHCEWEWLYGFDNRRRLFPIDGRYRFCCIVATKGGSTRAVRAAFLREDPADWAAGEPAHLPYASTDVARLSPRHGTFVETRDGRDLALLRRLHERAVPLLGDGGLCRWRQGDFNMTADRARFVPAADAAAAGWRAGVDGRWRAAHGPELRPLWQGAMLGGLHPNAGAFAGGTSRAVRWRAPADPLRCEPQYLVPSDLAAAAVAPHRARVALRALSNATNARTAIACLLGDEPCGNSLGVLTPRASPAQPIGLLAFVAGVLGSLVWDWALRQRLGGTNVNGFVLADTVLPDPDACDVAAIAAPALQLCCILPRHAWLLDAARDEGWFDGRDAREGGDLDRRALHARLDVAVARAFGLEAADLQWILRDCDLPSSRLRADGARTLDPKGFWRIDRELPPAERHPARVLALATADSPVP